MTIKLRPLLECQAEKIVFAPDISEQTAQQLSIFVSQEACLFGVYAVVLCLVLLAICYDFAEFKNSDKA